MTIRPWIWNVGIAAVTLAVVLVYGIIVKTAPDGLKGQLILNPPGTAKVGYSLMGEGWSVYLDLSRIPRQVVNSYLGKQVIVEGSKLKLGETEYVLVEIIKSVQKPSGTK